MNDKIILEGNPTGSRRREGGLRDSFDGEKVIGEFLDPKENHGRIMADVESSQDRRRLGRQSTTPQDGTSSTLRKMIQLTLSGAIMSMPHSDPPTQFAAFVFELRTVGLHDHCHRFSVRKPNRTSQSQCSRKFLHRPALAIVISMLILFLGALAINTLPISQFPSVAPPSVVVSVSYPGASAEVLVDSVLIILEQAINGVQDMRYMASAATSAGEATIQIIFEPGTDPNVAVVNVNNRIAHREKQAPSIVEREGIIVLQAMTSMLMYVNVYSTDKGPSTRIFYYNYVTVNLSCPRSSGPGASAAPISSATARMRCGSS